MPKAYTYKALRVRQASEDKKLVMFSAPSPHIARWSGVPQKKRFGSGEETAGFQREENASRVGSLADFYKNSENVIQNPLLCARRSLPFCDAVFESSDEADSDAEYGELTITIPDFESMSLCDVLGYVRSYLESRIGEPGEPDAGLLNILKERATEEGHFEDADDDAGDEDNEDNEDNEDAQASVEPSSVLFEESHIIDFWQEIACRHVLLNELGDDFAGDSFLGFDKKALLSYLKPVVLVDGQHRLRGAIEVADRILDSDSMREEIEDRIAQGEDAEIVRQELLEKVARPLPISLLMSDEPSEQVFQFVVVNQKATPIGKALLGTIVSTSLSNEEMESVASRLKDAGIELTESKVITYLARLPESPFCGLIERGLTGDNNSLLQWNVFASLIQVFRDLKGGKLFGAKNDYADIWRQKCLSDSQIVSDYDKKEYETAFQCWNESDGPWRDVFIQFWSKIRDEFGNLEAPDKPNYWGSPRNSNLFNKVSLTILAADFFRYMATLKITIESASDVPTIVDGWLEGVNRSYFDRDWNLAGVKKDSVGIRSQWADVWANYREAGGSLPHKSKYRQVK